MNILMIASNDPAGMAIAFTNGINRYTTHRSRLITLDRKYSVNFQTDLHVPDLNEEYGEIEALLRNADVVHFHNLIDEDWPIGPLVIRNYTKGKELIYHEHGHPYFLANAEAMREKSRKSGHRVLVSTPDLLKLWPGSTWLPNIVPINDAAYLPRPEGSEDDSRVRICQAPTRKWHKNTDDFLSVMDELMKQVPQVERVVIENKSHAECLKIKRTCDIVFDHMLGHFGISSLESLSQGVPVVAGLDAWNIEKILEVTGAPDVPWVIARNRAQLKKALVELVQDAGMRREIGHKSREWMERYWTDQRWVESLVRFYQETRVPV